VLSSSSSWLRTSRGGLFALAAGIGAASGVAAIAFRYLVQAMTWLFTGSGEFGQGGHVVSGHLPWLGMAFYVLIPVIGGAVYGPVVYRYAREARGHGVPEVMVAVAENGGRVRGRVAAVKAFASALTIGTGGSVGREGPIVQIGSALASSIGQRVRVPGSRLRILVACGAGGAIAATFNAPIAGVFFGIEIILREMSAEAAISVMLSAMLADAVARPVLGSQPFLAQFPQGATIHSSANYLLIAVLALVAALVGQAFRASLYKIEEVCDRLWGSRPEWARPIVGGLAVGVLLLAVPQMYGVGYPVMFKALAGDYTVWFLLLLIVAKIVTSSLTLGVGGSGGVFAPSLFVGLMTGVVYGALVTHVFGAGGGDPAVYAAVGMAGVFGSATRAPLTALASVVEMTGDFAITLPIMLTVAIATLVSRKVSYGTIYTTKLLGRGQDVDRTSPWRSFVDLRADEAMDRASVPLPVPTDEQSDAAVVVADVAPETPRAVLASDSLVEVLRQLQTHGDDAVPVLDDDAAEVVGWVTHAGVLRTIGSRLGVHPDPLDATGDDCSPGDRVELVAARS
jgi:CIC family chloride channel protein